MITEDDRCEDGSTHLSCINAIINYSCDDDEVVEADEMSMMYERDASCTSLLAT